MCFGGGSDTTYVLQQQQAARENLIRQGQKDVDKAFSGFTPQFYQQVQKNTLNTLLPQVNEQYKNQQDQLAYGLANRGLLHSSAAGQLGSSLQREGARNTNIVGNQSIAAAQDLQRNVAQQKNQITGQLVASGDPTLAATQAVQSVAGLQAPSILQPLGNLFQGWGQTYLASRLNNIYNQGGGQGYQQQRSFSTPLPNNSTIK